MLQRRSLILQHWRAQLLAALAPGRVKVAGEYRRACGRGAGTRRQPRDKDDADADGRGAWDRLRCMGFVRSALQRVAGFRGGRPFGVSLGVREGSKRRITKIALPLLRMTW